MVQADFDQVLDEIGPFGPYQVYNMVLLGLAGLPVGANSMANVFLAGLPDHSCRASQNASRDGGAGDAGAGDGSHTSTVDDGVCYYTTHLPGNTTETSQCTDWDYDDSVFGNTMASEVS